MLKVEALALRARRTKGMEHHSNIWALRQYVNNNPDEEIVRQISLITDLEAFPSLWEVGLSASLQAAAVARWKILTRGQP